MSENNETTAQLEHWLNRLQEGDSAARDQLIATAQRRLEAMARRLFHQFPKLRRWEETGDILNAAVIRLQHALQSVHPDTPGKFFGLAGRHIRYELLDLNRHYFGKHGLGHNHQTDPPGPVGEHLPQVEKSPAKPSAEEQQVRYLELVEGLPEPLREVIDLIVYYGKTQAEAALLLGVTERTIRQRKVEAEDKIGTALAEKS